MKNEHMDLILSLNSFISSIVETAMHKHGYIINRFHRLAISYTLLPWKTPIIQKLLTDEFDTHLSPNNGRDMLFRYMNTIINASMLKS